jgi:hypothetical protein
MDMANTIRMRKLTARNEKTGAAISKAEIRSMGHSNA